MICAIGLMSGTSADGVTACAVRVGPRSVEPLLWADFPYRPAFQRWVLGLAGARAPELGRASMILGERFARAAWETARRARRRGASPAFVASHGQTVFHDPPRCTLQIGEPAVIAERTGLTVVSDFRPADLAAGGQAAPLLPFFDHVVFSKRAPVAVVNVGGIANVTFVTRDRGNVRAFDTGPGNAMIDEAVRRMTRGRLAFDAGGALAAEGAIDGEWLSRLLRHPFLRRRGPKSACRSDFVPKWIDPAWRALRKRPLDLIATLTYFTAVTIADALRSFECREVLIAGGGAFNRTLLGHLEGLLFPRKVRTLAELGWHPKAREPAGFALLGYYALRGLCNSLPAATGARRPVVLGRILPGSNYRRLVRLLRL